MMTRWLRTYISIILRENKDDSGFGRSNVCRWLIQQKPRNQIQQSRLTGTDLSSPAAWLGHFVSCQVGADSSRFRGYCCFAGEGCSQKVNDQSSCSLRRNAGWIVV